MNNEVLREFRMPNEEFRMPKCSAKYIVSLYRNRPILFLVLHPDNFSEEEAIALKRSGLGYGGVKIIRMMHRKIK